MIVVLTGGTGGAKFVDGVSQIVPEEDLSVIVNTADDLEWWGLYVSPDVDSITYVLSGLLSEERGWGVKGETFFCQQTMKALGQPVWFNMGDRDLGLHLCRTKMLHSGKTLSEATEYIASQLGIRARILPMCNAHVETRVDTPIGELSFQEYFVKRWYQDPVNAVYFAGIEQASPAPGVLDCIMSASAILLAPSNPITSIAPILAVPGVRTALRNTPATIAAVSPIVKDAAVSGPAGILMASKGLSVSIAGIADAYHDFLDILVVDHADQAAAEDLRKSRPGLRVHCTSTVMKSSRDRINLAQATLNAVLENSLPPSGGV